MSSFFLFLEKYELTILVSMHKFTNEKKANNLSKQYFDYTLVCCRLKNTNNQKKNQFNMFLTRIICVRQR